MEIPVVVVNEGGVYRAWCRSPVPAEATGASRYEATAAVADRLKEQLGTEIDLLILDATAGPPWLATAGSVPEDQSTAAWEVAVAEYRRQSDPPGPMPGPAGPTIPPVPEPRP